MSKNDMVSVPRELAQMAADAIDDLLTDGVSAVSAAAWVDVTQKMRAILAQPAEQHQGEQVARVPVERDERAAFEVWLKIEAEKQGYAYPGYVATASSDGDYCSEWADSSWSAWQARAALDRKPSALVDQLQADLTARDERIDALSLDAGRYRWLRDPENQCAVEDDSDYYMPTMICGYAEHEDVLTCEALDKAIDQAMAKEAQP
ncbi:hypothetical protein [Pseudomonas sichuanensis]|uniref:hypothetical protein n=1 Tax=Pseudomonas sichuanensis TaxID=2213015 RepID=UPI000DA6A28A|nr:hypothetical protein [Pseudomonas sichuanensis]